VKIDRSKLNTLLRSGLNPEIKTRKQLAAHLNLDPTSLTRWFATRDRLGNPRYPVVPDRHVTNILTLFNLSAQCLSLSDDEFREHCFELSLLYTKAHNADQKDIEKKSILRLEQIAKRKLALKNYPTKKVNKTPFLVGTLLFGIGGSWFYIEGNFTDFWQHSTLDENPRVSGTKCWSGYASYLGDFKQKDDADPCHYGKLLYKALSDLKLKNKNSSLPTSSGGLSATQDYILFLSEQLDQQRINDKITINIELGKSELLRSNYHAAQHYFQIASSILQTVDNPSPQIIAEISALNNKINITLN